MDNKKRCFVIMPFGQVDTEEYAHNLEVYRSLIRPVLLSLGYESIRADELEHVGNITRDIIELLHESDLVIADLSGRNANVFYELGVRHALFYSGTIPIIKKGENLPFDIANYRAIYYSTGIEGQKLFHEELKRKIAAFENSIIKKSDNPVHDILGDKLISPQLRDVVSIDKYKEKIKELDDLKDILRATQQEVAELTAYRLEFNTLQKRLENTQQKIIELEANRKELDRLIVELKASQQEVAALEAYRSEMQLFESRMKQLHIQMLVNLLSNLKNIPIIRLYHILKFISYKKIIDNKKLLNQLR